MLAEYINKAIEEAEFERMENGRHFGSVSKFKGLWAEGETAEDCRHELAEALESWILLAIKFRDPIPVLPGQPDLNKIGQAEYAKTD